MKRIILALSALLVLAGGMQGKNRVIVERDAQGNKARIIEVADTIVYGVAKTDTLSVMVYHDSVSDAEREAYSRTENAENRRWSIDLSDEHTTEALVAIVAIVFIFGLPVFILLIIFYFRNKNRKAKYRLAELAIEKGQPLPEGFLKEVEATSQSGLNKGIKNIFLGIGLFIFLWSITDEFGLGCIGLLIMFTGFGQVVIHYVNQPKQTGSRERNEQQNGLTES